MKDGIIYQKKHRKTTCTTPAEWMNHMAEGRFVTVRIA